MENAKVFKQQQERIAIIFTESLSKLCDLIAEMAKNC